MRILKERLYVIRVLREERPAKQNAKFCVGQLSGNEGVSNQTRQVVVAMFKVSFAPPPTQSPLPKHPLSLSIARTVN